MAPKTQEQLKAELNRLLTQTKYGTAGFELIMRKYFQITAEVKFLDKDLDDTITSDMESLTSSMVPLSMEEGRQGRLAENSQLMFDATGGDAELQMKVFSHFEQMKELFEQEKDKIPEAFRPMIKANIKPFEWEKGDYVDAYQNNSYLSGLDPVLGCGPKPIFREENGKRIQDYKRSEHLLRGFDNSGPFGPYMRMFDGYSDLYDAEFERQKLVKNGYTAEQEAAYKEHLIEAGKIFLEGYEKIKKINMETPGKYDEYLENSPDEWIGDVVPHTGRVIKSHIGALRGEMKAAENGWGIDELSVLAQVGAMNEMLGNYIAITKAENEKLAVDIKTLTEKAKKAKDDLDRSFQEYVERADGNAELTEKELHEKQLLADAYQKAEQAVLDKKEELKSSEAFYESQLKFQEDLKELNGKVMDKKVTSPADKLSVIGEIEAFNEKHRETFLTNEKGIKNRTVGTIFADRYQNQLTHVKEQLTKGNMNDLHGPRSTVRMEQIIRMYGPIPSHGGKGWDKSISKEQFDADYPPYYYDPRKLPFTDLEIAALGMGATYIAPDAKKIYEKNEPGPNPEERFYNQSTMWIEDTAMFDDKLRETSPHQFHEVVGAGKLYAQDAMEHYAAGDKKPLAELIHGTLSQINSTVKSLNGLGYPVYANYAMLSVCQNLLRKDPELSAEFEQINNSAPEKQHVDLERMSLYRNALKAAIEREDAEVVVLAELNKSKKAIEDVDEAEFAEAEAAEAEADEDGLEGFVVNVKRHKTNIDLMKKQLAHLKIMGSLGEAFSNGYISYISELPTMLQGAYKKASDDFQNTLAQGKFDEIVPKTAVLDQAKKEAMPVNYAISFLATKEGRREAEQFAFELLEKYGLEYRDKGANMVDKNGQLMTQVPEVGASMRKFVFEAANRQILAALESGNLKTEEKKLNVKMYVTNLQHIQEEENIIQGTPGLLTKFKKDKAINHDIDFAVKQYTDFLCYDKSDSSLIKFLTNPEKQKKLLENTELIERQVCAEHYRNNRPNQLPTVDDNVAALENAQKGVWGGTKEYDKILADLKSLNVDLKAADAAYAKDGIYDANTLAEREKALFQRMQAYVDRKDAEMNRDHEKAIEPAKKAYEKAKAAYDQSKEDGAPDPELEAKMREKKEIYEALKKNTRAIEEKKTAYDEAKQAYEDAERQGENTDRLKADMEKKQQDYETYKDSLYGANKNSHKRALAMKNAMKQLEARWQHDSKAMTITTHDMDGKHAYHNNLSRWANTIERERATEQASVDIQNEILAAQIAIREKKEAYKAENKELTAEDIKIPLAAIVTGSILAKSQKQNGQVQANNKRTKEQFESDVHQITLTQNFRKMLDSNSPKALAEHGLNNHGSMLLEDLRSAKLAVERENKEREQRHEMNAEKVKNFKKTLRPFE